MHDNNNYSTKMVSSTASNGNGSQQNESIKICNGLFLNIKMKKTTTTYRHTEKERVGWRESKTSEE